MTQQQTKKGTQNAFIFCLCFHQEIACQASVAHQGGKHRPDAWNAKIIINYIHSCCCSGAPFLWYWPIGLCDAILSSQAITEEPKGLALHLCGLDSSNGKCSFRFPTTRRMLQKKQSKLLVRASCVTNVTMEMILSYLGSHAYIMDAAAALEYYTKS